MFPIKTSIIPLNLNETFYSNVWRFFLIETELEEPGRRQMHFGNTAGNVGQQGINSGNVAVGNQWNGGHGGYGGHYNYGRGGVYNL